MKTQDTATKTPDANERTISVYVSVIDATLDVTYQVQTREEWATLFAELDGTSFAVRTERVLLRWDLTDDDGTVIPPTVAAIYEYEIPEPVLDAVLCGVIDAVRAEFPSPWTPVVSA